MKGVPTVHPCSRKRALKHCRQEQAGSCRLIDAAYVMLSSRFWAPRSESLKVNSRRTRSMSSGTRFKTQGQMYADVTCRANGDDGTRANKQAQWHDAVHLVTNPLALHRQKIAAVGVQTYQASSELMCIEAATFLRDCSLVYDLRFCQIEKESLSLTAGSPWLRSWCSGFGKASWIQEKKRLM